MDKERTGPLWVSEKPEQMGCWPALQKTHKQPIVCLERANLFPTTAGMRILTGGFVDTTAGLSQGWLAAGSLHGGSVQSAVGRSPREKRVSHRGCVCTLPLTSLLKFQLFFSQQICIPRRIKVYLDFIFMFSKININ